MKKLFIVVFAAMASLTTVAQKNKDHTTDTVKYSCPMHATVTSSKPGKCGECGMDLTKSKKAIYSCPMHADITSDKPTKCSKCGMDLTKIKKENIKTEVTKSYVCPMHADVTSDKPGKCSKCGMNLQKVKQKEKSVKE